MSHEVEVTIFDENIPSKWLKKIQKLKTEVLRKTWSVGDINTEENRVKYYDRQILDQDIHIYWYSHQTIYIRTGHDIDRDNLKLFEKILGRRADIDVDKEQISLRFNCSDNANEPSEYEKFPIFKDKDDIPRMSRGYRVEISGYKWRDEIEA